MLFRDSAATVAAECLSGGLFLRLTDQFVRTHGHRPSLSEYQSWERSIPMLVGVLNDAGLGQVEVLLEYGLPLNSKRADAVLAGVHPETGLPSYVVVELKQWRGAEPDDEDPSLCWVGGYTRPVLHPVDQVRGYCEYLVSFNSVLAEHPNRLHGVAYLHNATEPGAGGLREADQDRFGMLFTLAQRGEFMDFLRARFGPASGAAAADELLAGKIGPSKQLMAVAATEVREREQFVLLDEQKVAYRTVLNAIRRARQADHKEVVVVTGGPGTGKSVIALSLLGECYRQGITALHATGSNSFTTTMRKVAGTRKREVRDLFKYFNSFMTAERNGLDVLLCDEAHRMRQTSANRYTPAANRSGKAQIEELIDAARVPVFLLDEHQVVRPGEMGTVAEIQAAAAAKGLDCRVVPLDSQFRCGGSDAYLRWVVRLLGLEPGGPEVWEPDGRMQLVHASTPQEMEAILEAQRAQGHSARMSAGYCWKWTKKVPVGQALPADVVIGDWERPWNVFGERSVAGAPPAALWATDPAGFGQVGCVYTAQGFEYDWSGVVLGPDLIWRGDRWVTDRTASKDPVFKSTTPDADVDRLIRNTYKVLLTRGMIGTVVYSTDAETREKLRELTSRLAALAVV
ncbi:DNA/RNA helicase domain-containing protein [Kitasatospora sp. NPDC004615]|uniref:DNA/RNA helicase domain-containing protein n=1 Tax=Kitasatospora sp. NPDC004615 TaxID=3364017 RepID=UPI003684658E